MRTLSLAFLLLAAAFSPLAGASASTSTSGLCYNYAYVADYQWHYVCVDPRGGTCAVYTYRSNGVVDGPKNCVVDAPTAAQGGDPCTRLVTDLDYSSWLCVDKTNGGCPVWVERRSGGTVTSRTCLGLPEDGAAVQSGATCIPTSGGLDYHSFLCVEPGNPKCPAYQTWADDSGVHTRCYPPRLP